MKIYRIIFLNVIFIIVSSSAVVLNAQNVSFEETATVQTAIRNFANKMKISSELPGFRVLYFFTTDRREMEAVERQFEKDYEHIPHEWKHDQPYYKLYAGNFVSKVKAMQLLSILRKDFPSSVVENTIVTVKDVYECRHKLK